MCGAGTYMSKILVVDDDEQLRTLLRRMLSAEGHVVTEASTGVEGIQKYRDDAPDLIIIDMYMPEKEGLETIQELRGIDENVKILAVSGGGNVGFTGVLSSANAFGAQRTLAKPFRREQLLEAVNDILNVKD